MKVRNTWAIRRDLFVGFAIITAVDVALLCVAAWIQNVALGLFALFGVPFVGVALMRQLILEHRVAKRRDEIALAKIRADLDGDLYDGLH